MRQTERQLDEVHAAVFYENEKFAEPLKSAVVAAGAALVGEHRLSELKPEQLAAMGADVLVINLERVLEKNTGLLEMLLTAKSNRIIFNDADATSRLQGSDLARWARHLAAKIMGSVNHLPAVPEAMAEQSPKLHSEHQGALELWVLGASIGGPKALRDFLSSLHSDLDMCFILVQHIGLEFIQLMAGQLDQAAEITVRVALEGDALRPGRVLVVPPGKQLLFDQQQRIQLQDLPENSPYSPCIDQVLNSALEVFGEHAHAIVFSGMAYDAIQGVSAMMEKGCQVWVQNPETCVVSSMVDGSLEAGGVCFSGSPAELAARINQRSQDRQMLQT